MQLSFWGKSRVGLGGMENKVASLADVGVSFQLLAAASLADVGVSFHSLLKVPV